MTIGEAEYLS